MIQQTSLEAFESIKFSLGEKQLIVYNMLKDLSIANNTILAKKLGWPINRITPRINELRKMRYVTQDSIRICPITKKSTIFWKINEKFALSNKMEVLETIR